MILKNLFLSLKGNRPNPALISTSSQNQLEEYVDILQVQQLLLENSTASLSSASTVNTASYSSPASTTTIPSSSKNLQTRPRVNLQKAAEFSQVQGNVFCEVKINIDAFRNLSV